MTVLSLLWLPLLQSRRSRRTGPQELWLSGFVVLKHLSSSWTRDWACSPCLGRWTLHHWTPRKFWHHFKSNVWKNWALPVKIIEISSGPFENMVVHSGNELTFMEELRSFHIHLSLSFGFRLPQKTMNQTEMSYREGIPSSCKTRASTLSLTHSRAWPAALFTHLPLWTHS